MKFNIVRFTLLMLAAFSLTMVGCLKDKAFDNGEIQSGAGSNSTIEVVSIGLTVSSTSNFLVASFNNSNTDTTVQLIPVTLGGTSAATQDIHVTLTANDSLISNYDTANGTDYIVPPSSIITVANGGVVTIPKGQRTGYLQVTFKPSDFLGVDYAVGFTITKIQEAGYTISGNLNNGIVAIGIKNKYDGQYAFTIKTTGWSAYGISDGVSMQWPSNLSLITTGATSVIFNTAQEGSLQPAFTTGGSPTAFGATEPQFTFDTNDKLVSVDNLAPADARNRAFKINPSVTDSRYDPSSKTIYAAYLMTQNGRPTQYIYDTLVYVGPR